MTDRLFQSDNEWGIPTLSIDQPLKTPPPVDVPFVVWGSTMRGAKHAATWCFYTDDYRFAALWREPLKPTNAVALVECNFSVVDDSPTALAVWATYRKRWLSACWQQEGIAIWVDMCVGHRHMATNLIGVPRGWQRYATAAWDERVDDLDFELETAERHAAGWPFTLIVYGGGKRVTEWCAGRANVARVGHRSNARRRPGQGTRRAAALSGAESWEAAGACNGGVSSDSQRGAGS